MTTLYVIQKSHLSNIPDMYGSKTVWLTFGSHLEYNTSTATAYAAVMKPSTPLAEAQLLLVPGINKSL